MAVPKLCVFSLQRWMDETFGSPMVHHRDTIHIEKLESEVFKALEKQTGAVCCPSSAEIEMPWNIKVVHVMYIFI